MPRILLRSALCAMAACAGPAIAGDDAICADRPGLGTPPCIAPVGHPVLEVGLGDVTRDSDADMRSDTLVLGSALARFGVGGDTEVRIGWDGTGQVITRDRMSGLRTRQTGVGDVTLGLQHGFGGSDGPAAVQAFVTVPTGGEALGRGDWGAGLLVPMQFDLDKTFSIGLTPEVDAAVDADRSGRHVAYGGAAGVAAKLTDALTATVDAKVMRDDDPDGATTQARSSASLAWLPRKDLQFDVGAVAGLNAETPDIELYVGVATQF